MLQDAIGAIDGTYVPCVVFGEENQARWRNRKGFISHNVMAVVNYDMEFMYILPGWEGSAADMTVLRSAAEDHGFSVPPGTHH